uniref:Solute carrier organic anion transporter family member n=1 Tax=Sus scrofa TaxID=9823 RepID=A0A8D1CK91_PIG
MKGSKGIDNPAFVASSPDTPRRLVPSPSHVEVSVLTRREDSQPQEPQKSPDLPLSSVTTPGSQEGSGPVSQSEFEEGPCGWGNFQPQCFQRCNTPRGFLFHYCLLALTQGIVVNGLVNISISTIEKRYELKSSLTGLISSSYDISFCLLSLFVSYIGERGHKPRWLAFASFMLGLGALVFSLPKFFSGRYQLGSLFEDACLAEKNKAICTASSSSLFKFLYVFILGQLLLGTGGTPLYTLGTAFIDDSVPTHKSSLYIGIGFAMSVLGPAFGYVLGGQLLTVYIDVDSGQSIDVTEDDPRWLGAWWIGFLLSWLLAWSLIIPFSCFPKHLPGTEEIQDGKISQAHQSGSVQHTDRNFGQSFKDFPAAVKNLMRNTVFMCLVLSTCSEALVATGFATFLPKFVENQFGFSSSSAATLAGSVLVPGAALGQILGGMLVSKFKMTCKNIMKFTLLTTVIALILSLVFLYTTCENAPFAGVSESYNGTGQLGKLTAPCNANCNCLRSYYYPLCGGDGVQYFSPCYAGCTNSISKKHPKVICCYSFTLMMQYFYVLLDGLPYPSGGVLLCLLFPSWPISSIQKCVNQNQRSLALGIQCMLLRILGTIPGPIIFGIAIDSTCVLWDINKCGIKGACWVYNNIQMAYMFMAISVICKIFTVFFNGCAVFLYKPPPSATDVPFQDQDAVVTTVSLECDLNEAGNKG